MTQDDKYRHQRKFIETRKAEGLERLTLWVKPEDKPALKEIARQPHAIAKRLAQIEAEIRRELGPRIEARVAAELKRKTRRAMIAQKRAQARRQQAGANRPPERIRFKARPPGEACNRLKAIGALYNPVAAVWELPDDPEAWPAIERLLDELDRYGIERLSKPLDE